MAREVYRKIIDLVIKAAELARTIGIQNLLQPGLVKEMIMADILEHELITTKRGADARNPNNPSVVYEYLSCQEDGTGQLDRMFKAPADKRRESLKRISRNDKIYFAVFYQKNQTKAKIIYELRPEVMIKEAERQLDSSRNDISHVGFPETWVRLHGKIVYEDAQAN